MKKPDWKVSLGIILLVLSALCYSIHYLIFRDAEHIFKYMLGDIAFVFIEVLMVTLLIHRVLEVREKKGRLQKLNMVIGVFFSEVGTPLLKFMAVSDKGINSMRESIAQTADSDKLEIIEKALSSNRTPLDVGEEHLARLKTELTQKRDFLLRLLENQNLLEHESFTDTLWAVFHLTEELVARASIDSLPDKDLMHLGGDATRAYRALSREWLAYMKHLKSSYPYLYSLALRTDPFDPKASPIVNV
jgi:hypothetical protein